MIVLHMIGFLFLLMLGTLLSCLWFPFLRRLEGAQRDWIACVGASVIRRESLHGHVIMPFKLQMAAKKHALKKGNCPSCPLKIGIFPMALILCMFSLNKRMMV